MKPNSILKIVNAVLAILFVNMILTGFLHDALSHKAFEILHQGGGVLFTIVTALHVILNWNWIKANFFGKPSADRA